MDNTKLFEAALSAKMSDYPFSDTKTVMNNIMERAEKMKNHENAKQMKFTEITPEYIKPKKSHKAISVVAGIAGTAAVLTGAVFGLNWLNEHGGLKEREIESDNGAGYNDTAAETTAPISENEKPTLTGGMPRMPEETVYHFNGFTVEFTNYQYDGMTLHLRYNITYENGIPDDHENDVVLRTFSGNVKINPVDSTRVLYAQGSTVTAEWEHTSCEVLDSLDILVMATDESAIPKDITENYKFTVNLAEDVPHFTVDTDVFIGTYETDPRVLKQINICRDTVGFVLEDVPSGSINTFDAVLNLTLMREGETVPLTEKFFDTSDGEKHYILYKLSNVSPNTVKSVTVNGREIWELPDLTGMNIDDAAGTLQKLGINYSITRSESNEVPENCVIRTVPEAGAAVEKKSTIVAVYVSSDMPSSFETFAEAGEAYGYDLLDFGVGARIYTTSLYGCDIIQSFKYVDNYPESGTVTTTIGTQDSKSEKPELTTQTVLIADTPEDRISGLAQMNGFDPEKLEHESYFSDNLGLTVDTYYGREENVQGSLNTVDIWSLALIDDGNVLYVLSFENIGGLTDVLTGAMRVTDPRTGYWEGDDAIDILKQYAGEDYCFPFEKLEKEKVSYYDGDKWTNSDEIMFNFAVGEEGVPIKAITSGTVIETFSRNVPGYGEGIYITIQATDGRKWRYRHLSDFYVTEGDTVRAGDVIAAVGATGWCTGPCLSISFPDDEAEPQALEGGIVRTATNID